MTETNSILIVDADYDVRLMVRDALEREGYQVISVGSLLEAINVVRRHPVGLIITRLAADDMDPGDFARQLADIQRPGPPVIAIGTPEMFPLFGGEASGTRGTPGKVSRPEGGDEILDVVARALGAPRDPLH